MEGFEDWGDFTEEDDNDNGIEEDSVEYYFDLIKQFTEGGYLSQFLPNFPECVKRSEAMILKTNQTLSDF